MRVYIVLLFAVSVLCLLTAPWAMAAPTALTGNEANTVVLYNFDELAGGNTLYNAGSSMFDSSPNQINGRNYFATRSNANTDLGTGFGNFVRVDSRVGTPANGVSANLLKGDFTLEMWVRNGTKAIIDDNGMMKAAGRFFSSRAASGSTGWALEIYKNATTGLNTIRTTDGTTTVDVASGFSLPTTTWTHWAASFVNTNPGNEDVKYSVSLYISPMDATVPNLVATFNLDPPKTATTLAAYPLVFNGDASGSGLSTSTNAADAIDGCRLSNVARASFETLPEPTTLSLLALAGLGLLRRRK